MCSDGKKLKILIVSQFYYPDITACAFRMHETAQILAEMGHEVHVVGGEPHKGQVSDSGIDDGKIKVVRVELFKNPVGKWNYIRHYLSFMFGAIKAARKLDSVYDVVWASSPPLFTGIAGWAIAREKGAKFCLDIRDIWPESAVVAGQISGKGVLFNAAKIIEKMLYDAANQITCVAKPMAEYIKTICAGCEPVVIYNAISESMLSKGGAQSFDGNLNILYIGNMGFCQNLNLVLDAAKILQNKNITNIRFVMIGNGVEKQMLGQRIQDENIELAEIRDVVSKEKAIELMGQAHALMLHLKDDGTMDKTIPSKVFDYMAAGRPVLYGLKGEACDILGGSGGNLKYDPADAQSLADVATTLLSDYSKFSVAATKNVDLVKSSFLREAMTRKLVDKAFLQN
ncbi:MAG: glycosyltransferase family 4 protein [Candidatus Riflebacteria bacterium]|nr:glycosyltransferase family 4 protein [Candidatus Riflebacteria bacterium]